MVRNRALVVAATVVAALVVWAVAEYLIGIDLHGPAAGDREPMDVAAPQVLVTSLLVGLVGWGTLALLERLTTRGRLAWTVVALVVAVLSLAGPLTGSGVSAGNRLWLVALHVVVAVVLIVGLRRQRQPA